MTHISEANSKVHLPSRYHSPWRQPFDDAVRAALQDGSTVLDVGSGRNPTVPPADRPATTRYVGLDVSRNELLLAGQAAYDELVVADLAAPVPALVGTVDVAMSWQVFEHVRPLDQALDNLHSYLKPGGTLVSLFSGSWSVFGIVNRLLPNAAGRRLVETTMRRRGTDHPVFPAYYDRCAYGALRRMTPAWTTVEIFPLFRGATSFTFLVC